jgi:Domain of unknown function (DUF4258)
MKETKTEKIPDLLTKISECINRGQYRFSKHAFDRGKERFLSIPNILEVLNNGYHEKAKDAWDNVFKAWNYAIRGSTINNEPCRVIISFDDSWLLIITVIRLGVKL